MRKKIIRLGVPVLLSRVIADVLLFSIRGPPINHRPSGPLPGLYFLKFSVRRKNVPKHFASKGGGGGIDYVFVDRTATWFRFFPCFVCSTSVWRGLYFIGTKNYEEVVHEFKKTTSQNLKLNFPGIFLALGVILIKS